MNGLQGLLIGAVLLGFAAVVTGIMLLVRRRVLAGLLTLGAGLLAWLLAFGWFGLYVLGLV